MIQVNVLYPNGPDAKFDHDYYATKHFGLVGELLGPMKLRGGALHKAVGGPAPGVEPAFVGGGYLLFDSVEDFQAAMATHGPAIMGDIPNYTNVEPVIYVSEVTAGG